MSTAAPLSDHPCNGCGTPPSAEHLPDDLAVCHRMILELLATLGERRLDIEQLRSRLDQLLRRVYGPRAERYNPDQPLLFPELLTPAEPEPPPPPEPKPDSEPKKRKHRGRKPLPKNLRRERVEYKLSDAERICPCCGKLRQHIGVSVTEQLDYEPASLFVLQHVQHAYACAECEGEVARASKEQQPINKGLPGPGLMAHLVVSKFTDHLPLYRQAQQLHRQGVDLSRSTLGDWMAGAASLLEPLYREMCRRVMSCELVHTDDTPVPVLDGSREHTRTARLWGYLGDWTNPFNVFDYTADRTKEGPLTFMAGLRGYLQADAYTGYDRLFRSGGVIEVACNAHARRKFNDAKDSDPAAAHRALATYQQLFHIESEIREAEAKARGEGPMSDVEEALFRTFWQEQIVLYRQEYALPIWIGFLEWLKEQKKSVLPKSVLAEAITYVLNQEQALTRYLWCGLLQIDNNWAEREMKRIAIGRKNYMFFGSDTGGKTAAVLYSFVSTCQRHDLDPFVYLRDILRRLPTQPPERLAELLPDRWQLPPPKSPPPASPPSDQPPPPTG